ncbi:hypothetical protein DV736_g2039, partial [Chaetothyriales sp. CBS 134916]
MHTASRLMDHATSSNEANKTAGSTTTATPPKRRSLSDTKPPPFSPSAAFREPNVGGVSKDDSAIRPSTPHRPSLVHSRGLSLTMPPSREAAQEGVQAARVLLSPKLETANIYSSPASMLPRRSRGLDYTRACTSLHHSTLAESSPDASPITGRGVQIPHRRSLAGTSVLDSPSNLSALLWSAMPERTTLSSSVSSINMLDSDDETDTSSDNGMAVDNDDPMLSTPAVSRLGRSLVGGGSGVIISSPGMEWASQRQPQQLLQQSPAHASLMSYYPMSFRRARTKRGKSQHSSSSVSMASLKPSPGSLSPSASKNTESAGYFAGLTRARAQSRRESLNLGTNNLQLSDGDDAKPNGASDGDGGPGDVSASVVRRAVTRRGNLLPKTKGFARIKAALMEEATPADSELRREAEVIKQVHDNDPTFSPNRSPRSTNPFSPDLVQRSIEDSSAIVPESKIAPFSLHAERNSAGLGFWNAFDGRYSTPPPAFRARDSSSAVSDDANDTAANALLCDQHPGHSHFSQPRSRSTTPLANLGPPTAADAARRVNNKRRRDDDFDLTYTKRRAVSPGMSVASSPVLPQSPIMATDKGWAKPPPKTTGAGERSSSGSSLNNGLKKSGSSMASYKFDSSPLANAKAIVQGPNYRFTVLTDRLLRYEWAPDNQFEDRASTFAINRHFPTPKFSVKNKGGDERAGLEIITDHFHVDYDGTSFSSSGLMASFSAKVTSWGAQWRFGQTAPGNLGGTARTLDEVDGRCDMGLGVCSRSGFAVVNDSDSMLFDGNGFVAGRRPSDAGDRRVDGYLFAYGHDYRRAIQALYQLSGKQPLLPRWALGNWWSRYYRYHQQEYIDLVDKFKDHDVPLSVAVVDMDWHLVNDDRVPHSGWTGYTWDDAVFPQPEVFGKEMHGRNLKITLNDHPHAGIHHHEDSYEEMAKALGHDASSKIPILFDPTNADFMHAYLTILHRNIEKVACDFWWIDWQQGTFSKVPGVDPLWVLNHFHMLDSCQQQGGRGIIFSRFAGPGSQRYPVGFSGDTITTWASLAFQPEFTATASNIGYGWWSHDIGGHMLGIRNDELVTRWVQLGVWSPIMRLHSTSNQWASKEPWLYRKESEETIEAYMRLRHRLIPYLYNMNVRAAIQDEPLVQPLYWHFPDRDEAYKLKNNYFFGSDLLVCPIVTKRDPRTNLAAVKAWLPPRKEVGGKWIDIFTGTVYDADRELKLYRPLSDIPVLARQGAIITLDAASVPSNGGVNPEAYELLVVVGRDGQATVFEDPDDDDTAKEALTSPGQRASPRKSEIEYNQESGTLTVRVAAGARKEWTVRFLGLGSTGAEKLRGLTVGVDNVDVTAQSTIRDAAGAGLVVQVRPTAEKDESGKNKTIVISLGQTNPQLAIVDHQPRIRELLLDCQVEFALKDKLWAIVDGGSSNVKIGSLLSVLTSAEGAGENGSLDEGLLGPIAELILADSREG